MNHSRRQAAKALQNADYVEAAGIEPAQDSPRSRPWRPAGIDLSGSGGKASNVYVIQEGDDGPVKIGVANDPPARLAGLQFGNPRRLRLVCWFPIGKHAERRLHMALAAHRMVGEWFAFAPAVRAAVDELVELSRVAADFAEDVEGFCAADFDYVLADLALAGRGVA